ARILQQPAERTQPGLSLEDPRALRALSPALDSVLPPAPLTRLPPSLAPSAWRGDGALGRRSRTLVAPGMKAFRAGEGLLGSNQKPLLTRCFACRFDRLVGVISRCDNARTF